MEEEKTFSIPARTSKSTNTTEKKSSRPSIPKETVDPKTSSSTKSQTNSSKLRLPPVTVSGKVIPIRLG